jgi:hypothetical protein
MSRKFIGIMAMFLVTVPTSVLGVALLMAKLQQ